MTSVKPFGELLENINKLYPKELVNETEKVILAYRQLLENQNQNTSTKPDSTETKNKIINLMKSKLAERDNDFEEQKNKYECEINNLRGIIQIERDSYTKDISDYKSKITELESQLIKMENDEDEDQFDIERLKHKLNATEEALKYTRSKLEESDIELTQLLDIKSDFDKIKDENETLLFKLTEQETNHSKSCELIENEYKMMCENEKDKNRLLKEENNDLKRENDNINQQLKNIEIVNRDEKQKLALKVAENLENACELKEELDSTNKQLDKMGSEYKKLEIDYMKLVSINKELKSEFKCIESQYIKDINKFKNESNEFKDELNKTEEALQKALDGKKELLDKYIDEQNNNWDGQYNALESDYNDMALRHKNEIESINKRYCLLKQTYETQSDMISDLQNENYRLEKLLESNSKERSSLISQLRKEIYLLESSIYDKSEAYSVLMNDCVELKTQNLKLLTQIDELKAYNETEYGELESMRLNNDKYIQEKSELIIEKNEMLTLINDLKSQLGYYKDIDEKYQKTLSIVADKEDTNTKLKNMFDDMNTKLIELGKKYAETVRKHCSDMREAQFNHNALQKEVNALQKELNDSKRDYNKLKCQSENEISTKTQALNDTKRDYDKLKLQSENEISTKTQALNELSSKFTSVCEELSKLKENFENMKLNSEGWDFVEHSSN